MKVNKRLLRLWLILIAMSFILVTVSAAAVPVDVNINRPYNDANYISNNVAGGKVFIDFNYVDGNFSFFANPTYSLDANIYYSTTQKGYQNVIVTDLNLEASISGDSNFQVGGPDSNRFVWVFDTSKYTITDGNYFIDINLFNNSFKRVGSFTDGNVDTNSSGKSFIIDNTNPTAGITSSGGDVTSTDYTLTWTTSDATAGVKRSWVSQDNSTWTNVGTATSYTFSIAAGTPLPTTATYYVKSQDYADNNSTIQSISVRFVGGSSGSPPVCGDGSCNGSETSASCPTDCGPVCGDGACTGTESSQSCPQDCGPSAACGNGVCDDGENFGNCSQDCQPHGQVVREVVLSRSRPGKPTAQDIRNILIAAGASENAVEKASEAVGKTNVERRIEVVKKTDEAETESFSSTFTIKVSNTSQEKLKDLKVIEQIPKNVAERASQVRSGYSYRVLVEDPIIEFKINELEAGESAELIYWVEDQVSTSSWEEFLAPLVSNVTVEEVISCDDITCDDGNSCTSDSCSAGQCSFTPVADRTSCGFGKECRSSQCVQITQPVSPRAPTEAQGDMTLPIIAIVILVIVGAFYYYKKKESK